MPFRTETIVLYNGPYEGQFLKIIDGKEEFYAPYKDDTPQINIIFFTKRAYALHVVDTTYKQLRYVRTNRLTEQGESYFTLDN